MNFAPAFIYIFLFFLIVHIRWIAPIYNNRFVYATPLILCCIISAAIPFLQGSQRASKHHVYWCTLSALAISAVPSFNTTYLLESLIVYVTLFSVPIASLLSTQAARLLIDPKGGPKLLLLLSLAGVLQTLWMAFETKLGLTSFFRPNMAGSSVEWWFTNRAGADRARYTFASPMVAGAWAWFSGLILIVFGGFGNWSKSLRIYFVGAGFVSWIAILLSISRGPAVVALISLIALCIPMLRSGGFVRVIISALPIVIGTALFSSYVIDKNVMSSVIDVAIAAFDSTEAGNEGRLRQWETGLNLIGQAPITGNGLHSVSHLMGEEAFNFENTFLDIIFASGLTGWLYSIVLIGFWIVLLARLLFQTCRDSHLQPIKVFTFAAATGWFPYLFMFPCLQLMETAFITFSIFAMLFIQPWLPQSNVQKVERQRFQMINK